MLCKCLLDLVFLNAFNKGMSVCIEEHLIPMISTQSSARSYFLIVKLFTPKSYVIIYEKMFESKFFSYIIQRCRQRKKYEHKLDVQGVLFKKNIFCGPTPETYHQQIIKKRLPKLSICRKCVSQNILFTTGFSLVFGK